MSDLGFTLTIEAVKREGILVAFRAICFETDEETGARSVCDIMEQDLADRTFRSIARYFVKTCGWREPKLVNHHEADLGRTKLLESQIRKVLVHLKATAERRLSMFDLIIRGSIHEMTGDQKDYLLGKGLITLNEEDQTYLLANVNFTADDVTYLMSLSEDQ